MQDRLNKRKLLREQELLREGVDATKANKLAALEEAVAISEEQNAIEQESFKILELRKNEQAKIMSSQFEKSTKKLEDELLHQKNEKSRALKDRLEQRKAGRAEVLKDEGLSESSAELQSIDEQASAERMELQDLHDNINLVLLLFIFVYLRCWRYVFITCIHIQLFV